MQWRGLIQRAALTLSALCCALLKPPSSGNLQPRWPRGVPATFPASCYAFLQIHFVLSSCRVRILRCPARISLEEKAQVLVGGKKINNKHSSSLLRLHSGVKSGIHPLLWAHRNEDPGWGWRASSPPGGNKSNHIKLRVTETHAVLVVRS